MGKKIFIHTAWCFVGALIIATTIGVANNLTIGELIIRSSISATALSGVFVLMRHTMGRLVPTLKKSQPTVTSQKGSTIDISVGDDIQTTPPALAQPPRRLRTTVEGAHSLGPDVKGTATGRVDESPQSTTMSTGELPRPSLAPSRHLRPAAMQSSTRTTVDDDSHLIAAKLHSDTPNPISHTASSLPTAPSPPAAIDLESAPEIIRRMIQ